MSLSLLDGLFDKLRFGEVPPRLAHAIERVRGKAETAWGVSGILHKFVGVENERGAVCGGSGDAQKRVAGVVRSPFSIYHQTRFRADVWPAFLTARRGEAKCVRGLSVRGARRLTTPTDSKEEAYPDGTPTRRPTRPARRGAPRRDSKGLD